MKKTRLLEIVREEIAFALNEMTVVSPTTPTSDIPIISKSEKVSPDAVKSALDQAKKSGKPVNVAETELEEEQSSKYKQLAEKYQLDEETIMEMASIKQTIDGLKALGDERNEIVAKVAQDTLNQFKKDPIIKSDRLSRKLNPDEYPNKKERTISYSTEFLKNYKKETGKNFEDLTYEIESRWEEEKPGEKKPFKSPGLAANTTDKDAANQITGKEKSKPGPTPNPNKPEKPESTGKKGRPAGAAKEKIATHTPGADGFDNVTYSDVEDIDTEKAPAGDIEMEKAARGKDELVKQYKSEVESELKDKIAKAKEGDKDAMAWLKSKQDIIKKYNQAKQVKV